MVGKASIIFSFMPSRGYFQSFLEVLRKTKVSSDELDIPSDISTRNGFTDSTREVHKIDYLYCLYLLIGSGLDRSLPSILWDTQ